MKKKILLFSIIFSASVSIALFGQQQPENQGFEFWEEIGFGPDTLEPVGWNSLKTSDGGDMINDAIPVVWERSTDAHSGMYSIRLYNEPILTLVAPGTLTNGRVHATIDPANAYVFTIDSLPEFNTPFTDKPDSLNIWAKFFPQDNDIAHVIAILHTDTAKIADPLQTNWIAVANIDIPDQVNSWTKFSAPFQYLNSETPEYILFAMYAGDAQNALVGSELYLDDFELVYYNTAFPENPENNFSMYYSGGDLVLNTASEFQMETLHLQILDMSGRTILVRKLDPVSENRVRAEISKGVYICKIESAKYTCSRKFVVR
jgi:hypothetical protein